MPARERMSDWRYRLAEQRGTLLAVAIFLVMFAIYVCNHPAGFTANVVQTAANKGVLLALVAMAQTLVVLTAGIDLSVGMVFILTNCLASYIVAGSTPTAVLGLRRRARRRARLRRDQRADRDLRPAAADRHHHRHRLDLSTASRSGCGRSPAAPTISTRTSPTAMTGKLAGRHSGEPRRAAGRGPRDLGALPPLGARPRRLCHRLLGGRRLHVGRADPRGRSSPPTALSGLLAAMGGLYLTFFTYSGEASFANGGTYTLYSIAAVVLGGVSLFGGVGSAIGAIFGALAFRTIGDLLFVFDLEPLWQPLFQGVVLLLAVCVGAARLFQVRNRLDLFA